MTQCMACCRTGTPMTSMGPHHICSDCDPRYAPDDRPVFQPDPCLDCHGDGHTLAPNAEHPDQVIPCDSCHGSREATQ